MLIVRRLQSPPVAYQTVIQGLVKLRKLMLRHLALPRPHFMRVRWFTDRPDPKTGCIHALQYISHPYYIRPTFSRRWGMKAWVLWFVGGSIPSQDKPEFYPEGYKICEMGPAALREKGTAEMCQAKASITARRREESQRPKFADGRQTRDGLYRPKTPSEGEISYTK